MLENFVLIKEKILWLNSPIFILDRVYHAKPKLSTQSKSGGEGIIIYSIQYEIEDS